MRQQQRTRLVTTVVPAVVTDSVLKRDPSQRPMPSDWNVLCKRSERSGNICDVTFHVRSYLFYSDITKTFYRAMLCVRSADYAVAKCLYLSVRLSVIRRYSIETAKHIFKLFSPSGIVHRGTKNCTLLFLQ